jgi:peptidoglycan/LPS O-acetylase OafA/YrhL
MSRPAPPRLAAVDTVKAVASQLIVLHHLAFYGPMSDQARLLAPGLFAWLSEHARLAVQAFLVIGGFLAARALAPHGRLLEHRPVGSLLVRRYLRLAVPAIAAICVAVVAAAVARSLMDHDSIPEAPSVPQLAANLLLLQDLLGYDALSAGLWYVAIDLQLYILLVFALWAGRERALAVVAGLAIASLWAFNRDATLDAWAMYFFGAYALGAFAWWLSQRTCAPQWGALLLVAAAGALAMDFRIRIALALAVALALFFVTRSGWSARWMASRPVEWLGRIAYSVFLIHFPVCMVVNAVWTAYFPADPWVSLAGIVVAWGASVAAGAVFFRLVESRVDAVAARLTAFFRGLRRAGAGAE